jgi:hypothetical protein
MLWTHLSYIIHIIILFIIIIYSLLLYIHYIDLEVPICLALSAFINFYDTNGIQYYFQYLFAFIDQITIFF